MNKNSVLCNYIVNHTNWEEELAALDIKVKKSETNTLAIFNYGIMCDFANPLVQESRGIIIDLASLDVICWPFRKFGNYTESYVDTIDWTTAQVQEKVDGSIVKLYWYDNKWNWATNSCIDAKEAGLSNGIGNFLDAIKRVDNYKDIPFDTLNKDYTYIFELVSPYNEVVIKYGINKLYHTGTRNNLTGEEYNLNIGIIQPNRFNLSTFDDCIDAVNKLNIDSDHVTAEGFVVVDKDFHRIKIKSPVYIAVHHMINNMSFTKSRCLELLLTDTESVETLIKEYPRYSYILLYYKYRLAELEHNVDIFINVVRDFYEEYSHDRKAIALLIKKHQYSDFGFKALDNDCSAHDLIAKLRMSQLEDYIPTYEERNFITELTTK